MRTTVRKRGDGKPSSSERVPTLNPGSVTGLVEFVKYSGRPQISVVPGAGAISVTSYFGNQSNRVEFFRALRQGNVVENVFFRPSTNFRSRWSRQNYHVHHAAEIIKYLLPIQVVSMVVLPHCIKPLMKHMLVFRLTARLA